MKQQRKIIQIDEDLCNGCGNCITACAEGALQLVNGKAKLVKEQFCDGLGDCLGDCPTGALKITEAEVPEFDQDEVKKHLLKTQGEEAVRRMEAAAKAHAARSAPGHPPAGGCPGTRMRMGNPDAGQSNPALGGLTGSAIKSDLQQWPVQIHLVQPGAPFFKNKELVVLSTCAPVASADVHWKFIRGRSVAVGCPKLDDTDGYAEKLGAILSDPSIPGVLVVRMEVPCCGGLSMIVRKAVELSGRSDLTAQEVTVGLDGDVKGSKPL